MIRNLFKLSPSRQILRECGTAEFSDNNANLAVLIEWLEILSNENISISYWGMNLSQTT